MCGICGLAVPRPERPDERLLVRMRDVLQHRGPDDAGVLVEPGIGLGHRRLTIVDLTSAGHQPMESADGRHVIIYNGEVYNHPQLMAELRADGVSYRSTCDTETVLHLYGRHGEECVHHLRGMFAFAIWDRERRALFLARDRFGVKPLYYHHAADGTLVFGSEIKAVLASERLTAALNHAALPDYLANHAPSGDDTLYEGVRRLPPAHTLVWQDGRVTLRRYWDLPAGGDGALDGRTDGELVAEWRERFREAVRLRLMADVPLGMFLSGGIDSAAITAMMSGLVAEPVKTFSVAFAEREANELAYARMVAERFRTDHHEVVVSPEDFFAALPRLVWQEDEPLAHPSSVALYFVSRLAAEHVKVVLTGEGSDETLAGYNRYRMTLLNRRLGGVYARLVPGAVRNAVASGLGGLPRRSVWGRRLRRTFLGLPPDLDALYFDNFAVFPRGWQGRLLAPALRDRLAGTDPYAAFHRALGRAPAAGLLDRLLYADIATYLHELLMKQDQMSMAASIESRVPFLDHPLAEFAARLPRRLKLRGLTTKVVLRDAMRGLLPDPILARRKMGFPVPAGAWLRGSYRGLLEEFSAGERARARGLFDPAAVAALVAAHLGGEPGHDERVWSLVNLEIWHRVCLEGEAPEDVLSPARLAAVRAA
jgi:asparagine synthase (glutamine-hydrolysing)